MHRLLKILLLIMPCVLFVAHGNVAETDSAAVLYWGVGIQVSDLERSLKFYTQTIGMKERQRIPKAREIVLSQTGTHPATETFLTLIQRDPKDLVQGREGFGRLILIVSDVAIMRKRISATAPT
jgi:catechol 2,3-dioxygenase-like lactoylglutathione lyase family enzyme